MIPLNEIKSLLKNLRNEEVKSLLNFLRFYQGSKNETSTKTAELIEILQNEPNSSSKDIQFALYGRENYMAFAKLLSRTKDKIYETMLFDNNLSKPLYSDRNRVIFEIKKKLIQSEILYLRGITDGLESFHNKIISKAVKYELFDSAVDALRSKQRYKSIRFGKKEFEKIEGEIKYYEECGKAAINSRSIFTKIISKIAQSATANDYKEDLNLAVELLKSDFERTNSAIVGYYYLFLKTDWHQIRNEFHESKRVLSSLLKLLEENVSIYTKTRKADVLVNIALNEIYLFNFNNAISSSIGSQRLYEYNSANYFLAREMEFYSRFYSGDLKYSEEIILEIYNSSKFSNTPLLYSKRAYLYACLNTIKGAIDKSNELLSEVSEITRDKEGWNVGKRVLTIINRIESGQFDSADLQVMNLEKFIKRLLKFRHVRKRDIVILRILRLLIGEGFDFRNVYNKRKHYFDLLQSNDLDYSWKIKSPELIVFHKWFIAKMSGKPYSFNLTLPEVGLEYLQK